MRTAFLILMGIHSTIHLLWFGHAYGWVELSYFTKEIPGMVGFSWLLTALLFLYASYKLLRRKSTWFLPALLGVLLSQLWIFSAWQDTRWGTFANLLLLAGVLVGYAQWYFEGQYQADVRTLLENQPNQERILQEADLKALPPLLREYIRKSGAVGRPAVRNFRLEFEGEMREKGKPWFPFTAEQYSCIQIPERLFFMKARMKGLSVWGYHAFQPPGARMLIKVLSLIPVVKISAPELYPTEAVTFFNDICLFAPGGLTGLQVEWEQGDDNTVRGVLDLGDVKVSATLAFDAEGNLVDFRSSDRYSVAEMQRFPFTTPVGEYRDFDGIRLPSFGEAVWHYPDGAFAYGRFRLKHITYNEKAH